MINFLSRQSWILPVYQQGFYETAFRSFKKNSTPATTKCSSFLLANLIDNQNNKRLKFQVSVKYYYYSLQ